VPELPEVETTRRSLEPALVGRRVESVVVRDRRLRWPVPRELEKRLTGATIDATSRRAKYLLIDTNRGHVIVHLGMSGSLGIVALRAPPRLHDHIDVVLDDGNVLRFHDPRRFGSWHWVEGDPAAHPLLAGLAPEPLAPEFDAQYMHRITHGRSVAIKQLLMNGKLVTGVGNIYASEALHRAAINPKTSARRLSLARCAALVDAIKETLGRAIAAGGSTLRDYVDGHGNPGYFQQEYAVYDRAGEACPRCGGTVKGFRQGQRSTYYCPRCQRA
jgi:formamidopyrimidine-DNA glycosylase